MKQLPIPPLDVLHEKNIFLLKSLWIRFCSVQLKAFLKASHFPLLDLRGLIHKKSGADQVTPKGAASDGQNWWAVLAA